MKLKINSTIIIVSLIIILGLFLRTYKLGDIPAGFFCDEASIGYNAYSLLHTGKDEYSISFPIFFKAFGEYKNPIQIYSTVPFIAAFGLNEVAARLPSTIYGILCLIAIYALTNELFKHSKQKKMLALLSMFFLAISPWAIHFSRVSLEGLMAFTFFTTLGLYLFLRAQNLPKLLPLSITAFVFAIYSYFPARIFIPLFCIGLSLIYFRFFLIHKKVTIITFLVLIILLFPFIQNLFSPIGFARWHQVNIFSNPPENNAVFQHIISNYFGHFSVDFLFLKGDIDMPGQFVTRHSIRGLGELYLFQLPLVAFGLFSLLKRRNKSFLILLLWLLLYPVGSMFTTDNSPQGTRSIIGVIPFQILSAIGIIYLLHIASKIKKPFYAASISVSLIIVIVSLFSYVSLYFTSYVNYSSDFWGWQYGARDIVHYFALHETKYDNLIMAPEFNAPEIFFKFYAPNTCKKCVVGLPDTYYHPELKQLFVVTPTYLEVHPAYKFSTRKIIYYPNGLIAFRIGEIVK